MRMRDPYEVLGVPQTAQPGRDQEGLSAAGQEAASRRQQERPQGGRDSSPSSTPPTRSLGDEKKRKAFDRGEIDADGKPRSRASRASGRPPDPAVPAATAISRPSPGGREGHAPGAAGAGAAAAAASRTSSRTCWAAWARRAGARAGGGPQFEPEDFGAASRARTSPPPLTISLAEAANGATKRVHLPTGKEVDVKIPAGLDRRPADPAQGPGPGACRAAGRRPADHASTIAPHPLLQARWRRTCGSTCRSRSTRRCWARKVRVPTLDGAVELAIPPGTSRPHLPPQGQGPARQGGARRPAVTVRIVLPEGSDPELDELMRNGATASPTIRARTWDDLQSRRAVRRWRSPAFCGGGAVDLVVDRLAPP